MLNISKAIVGLFSLSLICLTGCQGPWDTLKGYDMGNTWVQDWVQSDWHKDYPIDKAIFDDFANFVRDNKIPLSDIMSAEYGKDKNGRKAIFFVQKMPTPRDSEVRIYILYYDKNNVRTKVKTWSDTLHC